MALTAAAREQDNILYELLVHAEWPLEPEVHGAGAISLGGNFFYRTLTQTPANIWSLASSLWAYLSSGSPLTPSLAKLVGGRCGWQLGVGAQGAVVAVVQAATLEIRAKKDEFASVVGKNTNLYVDPFPSWRRVAWSADCSMVGLAYSSGAVEVFSTLGTSIFTIYPPRYREGAPQVDASNALAALVFSDVRTQKIKWAAELLLVDYKGSVRSYLVSPTEGYQESHHFFLTKVYSTGITAATLYRDFLLVAGSCSFMNDMTLKKNGLGHGITLWRMLNDYPFYKQVATIDEEEYLPPSVGLRVHLVERWTPAYHDCVFQLSVSPCGRQLAALHTSGSLSIWELPSLRKKKFWQLPDQPDHDARNPSLREYVRPPGARQRPGQGSGPPWCHPAELTWWSEAALIVARYSGSVTVSSVASLSNLLGESPEFLEGVPQISEAYDRAFLSLEVEGRTINKRFLNSFSAGNEGEEEGEDKEHPDSEEEEEEEEEASLLRRSSRVAKNILYWVTDAERFRPHSRRPRVMQRTYRLLCLKSTTPEELFTRKIENEEYGEALALARSYGLDCDRVYQQQWRRSPVTVASIQDYLAKIRKRSWVLAECLTRVPQDIDAARELLLYGLRGTDLEAVIAIGEETDDGEFILCDGGEDLELEGDLDIPPGEYQARMQERAAKELKRRHQLLSKIDFANLTQEQKTVILARQKLLTYLDRLATYEVLLGGAHLAPEHYDAAFYDKFRSQSAITATIGFARDGDWGGVDVMFTYHGEDTLPHHLAILSNFPPTLGPYEYRSLLPECKGDKVFPWEQERLRDEDWCEEPACKEAVTQDKGCPAEFLYQEHPSLEKFRGPEVDGALVSEWYRERAREVERCSHFVDVALDLLKLGRERGVENLELLLDALDSLEVMVYEVSLSSMTLDKFLSLSDEEKITQLMSTSTPETYIQNIRRWLLPFLARCEKGQPGRANTLLRAYMVSTAKTDLGLALKILQHSRPDQPSAIIQSAEEMMTVAVESVYACERETQLPWAIACLECLPERGSRSSESLSKLHDLADTLEAHLNAAELLSSYGVNLTPRCLRDMQGDAARVGEVLTKITRMAAKRKPRLSDEDWRRLLYDTLELHQKVFACVEPQVCLQKVIEALLGSEQPENIRLAGELMETRADHSPMSNPYLQHLPFARAVQLVTAAATHYYNSSESHNDQAIDLALQCLRLIESEHEDIQQEKDLIEALQILPDFGINKLPLQVRLCEDRLSLVAECLSCRGTAYRHSSLLQHLAGLLRVCGDDSRSRQAKVLTLIAQAALKAGDFAAAGVTCEQLVGGEHQEGWPVCEALGRAPRYPDMPARARYLDFALTHATPDRLEDLLAARNEVELALLYARVNQQIEQQQDTTGDSEDAFVDAPAEMEEEEEEEEFYDGSEEMEGSGGGGSSRRRSLLRGTLGMTRSVLSATASTTSSLVSSVASKRFWKTAMTWMQPLVELSSGEEEESPAEPQQDTNADFLKQGCHAFYADLFQDPHISSLGIGYQSYAPPSQSSPALEFSLVLLRIALLEETLSLGATVKANKTVLVEAARGVLKEDLAFGLLLLLSLQEVEEAKVVLAALPRTDVSLQVTQYYAALQIYTRLHPWIEPGIAPAFLHPPEDLIAAVGAAVDSGATGKLGDEALVLVDLFKATQDLVEDYVQGQVLRRLGAGVDMRRFLADTGYKEDTVLGLALTLEAEVLELALALARKYQVSLWEVNMAHLQHLFSSGLDTEQMRQRVAERGLVAALLEKPTEFTTRMEESILPAIDGKDLERLLLYYTLLEPCSKGSSMGQAASHVKLLKKLKGVANGLDYKLLLRPDSDPLETLRPVLTADNVGALAKAMRGVPGRGGAGLEPSTVYCGWAQKHFFESSSDRRHKTASDWVHRYEACGEYLQRMGAKDALRFVRQLVFSDTAASKIPLDARLEITRRALKFCRQQQNKQKFTEDEEGWMLAEDGRVWEEVAVTLERWGSHLDLLRSSTFLQLEQSDDKRLKEYARRFARTGGDEDELQRVACEVLLEGGGLGLLQEVLAVFPEQAATTPEDIMVHTLKMLLNHWRTPQDRKMSLPEGRTRVDILDHLLEQVHAYLEEGGELLAEEEVLQEVRELCGDEGVALEARVEVLSVAEKHLSLSEEDLQLVRVMRTSGVVAKTWPAEAVGEVHPEQLASSKARAALLSSLASSTYSLAQAKALVHLLHLWPPFDPQEYSSVTSNPWLMVLDKVLQVTQGDLSTGLQVVWEAAHHAHALSQLPGENLGWLVGQLQGLGREALRCCCKVALLSGEAEVHAAVVEGVAALQEVTEADYDGELLTEIVSHGLVASVVPSPLYSPLVTHLMECGDPELVGRAVRQLSEAGHQREAASLACLTTSLPKSLLNAAAALRTYKRWL